MNISALAPRTISKLTLISLLVFPFTATPGYAVELVGKPVEVGRPSSSVASSAQTESQQIKADSPATMDDVAIPPPAPQAPQPPESDSEKTDIEHAVDEVRNNFHEFEDSDSSRFMSPDIIIPIVAMSLLFGGPVILIIILVLLHYRAKSRRLKNINMNIDKLLAAGRDIPIELLMGDEPRVIKNTTESGEVIYTRNNEMMSKGFRNIGLGVGWLIFLTIAFGIKIGSFGFILIGLGISQVIIWKLSDSPSAPFIDAAKINTVKVQD